MSRTFDWKTFFAKTDLNETQQGQFKKYCSLLLEWNKKFNITALTEVDQVLASHFYDSLALSDMMDMSKISSLADVGAGGGFPGIPLKIKYPHCALVLIEVNNKKVQFLHHVIDELGLENTIVCNDDWRTFLRKTDYPIDLFVARASLPMDELVRMFKPSCRYKDAQLVYWASQDWKPTEEVAQFITQDYPYMVGRKKRRLILAQLPA